MKTTKQIIFSITLLLVSFTCLRAQYSPSAPMNLTGQSNITISGKDFTSGSNGASIYLNNCSNIKIMNCRFRNIPTYVGVQLLNSTNVEIVNCYFESFSAGVYAVKSTGINVHCNSFKNIAGTRPRGQIVQFNGCYGGANRINYNILDHTFGSGNPEDLINCYATSGTVTDPIQIIGNNLRGGGPSTSGGGIMVGDDGGKHYIVEDNILVDPGQYGIGAPAGENIKIRNNKVYAKQQSFTNVGIYVGLQGEINAGHACVGSTFVVESNQVNWTNKNGIKNGWYYCACCPGAKVANNNWNAPITASILPATLSLNSTKCGISNPPPVTQSPYNGITASIPGKIEAENYDLGGEGVAYHDATSGNSGAVFRNDGVDIQASTDAGAGYNVGYNVSGEWLEYTVNVTAGTYKLSARVASIYTGKFFHIELAGVNISGTIAVPNTGGWQIWQTVSVNTPALTSGNKVLRIVMDTDGFNLNNISFTASSVANQAPTVSITSPSNAAAFNAPATISIAANASDADGTVSKVEFFNGSIKLGEDLSTPYSYTWNNVAAGSYTITARTTDNSGAQASASVNVKVNTVTTVNQAPVVSITSPASGASFTAPASITINASASDADGTISKVDFFNGSVLLGSDVTAPYSFTISSASAGTYSFKAIATDNAGATNSSAVVSVTVNNVSTSIGISGPSCVSPNIAVSFTLNSDPGFTSASWWTTGDATVQVDPADNKKVTITYTSYAAGTVTVSCGANFSSSPWYKEYTKTIQIGNCASAERIAEVVAAPHPFNDETTVSMDNEEKILSVKLLDIRGNEIINTGSIDLAEVRIGNNLETGIYMLHIVTESGSYTKRIVKNE